MSIPYMPLVPFLSDSPSLFLSLNSYSLPPHPGVWGNGWRDWEVGGTYIQIFFLFSKMHPVFFLKKIVKYEAIQTDLKKIIHLLFHYLEGVTFRWNFYSFNF